MSESARVEAAAVLRRIVASLPMPPRMAAYLAGYADALSPRAAVCGPERAPRS